MSHPIFRLLLLGLALAVAGLAGWWLLGEESPDDAAEIVPLTDRSGSAAGGLPSLEDRDAEHRSEPPEAATGSDLVTESQWQGEGTVRLLFRDALTMEPISDLPFVVFAERNRLRLLARGRSDDRGRAVIRKLPADAILIETDRRPPWAITLAAIWLEAGREEEHVVAVTRGGVLRGRTVDDLSQPLAGVEISTHVSAGPGALWYQLKVVPEIVGRSDAAGHFEIEALVSRSRGVWIVDGKPRPERFEEVRLQFDLAGNVTAVRDLPIAEGKEIDLGAVVLPRLPSFQGRVIDEDGRPVPGAVVTTDSKRRELLQVASESLDRQSYYEFEKTEGSPPHGAVTDADGRFFLERYPYSRIAAIGPTGVTASVSVPPVSYGEVGEVVIRLEELRRMVLEPVDANGERWGRGGREPRLERLRGLLGFEGGRWEPFEGRPDAEGLFELRGVPPAERVRSLTVRQRGWRLAHIDLPDGAASVVPVRIPMTPLPRHPLEVRVRNPSKPSGRWGAVSIRACLSSERGPERGGCCGLGASQMLSVAQGDQTVGLSVALADEAYTLHVLAYRRKVGEVWEGTFGPYYAGETAHEIVLPEPSEPEPEPDAETETETEERPPPPQEPEVQGTVELHVRDGESGEPLPWISFKHWQEGEPEPGQAEAWMHLGHRASRMLYGGAPPGRFSTMLPPGTYRIRISARGYLPLEGLVAAVAEGSRTELGSVTLTPLPIWRGRFVGIELAQLASMKCLVRDADQEGARSDTVEVDSEGRFELERESIPERLIFQVGWGSLTASSFPLPIPQEIEVARWNPSEEIEIPLEPWSRFEVHVEGIAPAHHETDLQLIVIALDAGGAEHRVRAQAPVDGFGNRVYSFRAPRGRYRLVSRGVLYRFSPVDVTVSGDSPSEPILVTAAR